MTISILGKISPPANGPKIVFSDPKMLRKFHIATKLVQSTPEATRLLFSKLDLQKAVKVVDLGGK